MSITQTSSAYNQTSSAYNHRPKHSQTSHNQSAHSQTSHKDHRMAQHYGLSERAMVMCERLAEIRGTSFPTQVSKLRGRRENSARAMANAVEGRKTYTERRANV